MEIKIKFGNDIKLYPNVEEAEKFLNEADYYCDHLEMLYSFEDMVVYDEDTDLEYLQEQANIYGEGWITVFQIME